MVISIYFYIIESIHVILLIVFMLIDTVIILNSIKEKFDNNEYLLFHKKFGVSKIIVVKLLLAIFIIYELGHNTIKSGALMAIIFAYCIFVSKFIVDYISFKRKKSTDQKN